MIWGIIIISGIGYFAVTRDISEMVGIIAVSATLFLFGIEDILVYLFQGLPLLSASLPWLDNHIVLGNIANLLHQIGFAGSGVTGETLLASGFVGLVAITVIVAVAIKLER